MQWVLATGNKGKVWEIQHLLQDTPIRLIPQSELQVPEIEETGLSFIENALLKARNAAQHTGLPALADDSGLIIDHLQGAPGIYSARYAGVGATNEQHIQKVLAALEHVPRSERKARFYCVLALVTHALDPLPRLFQGEWSGSILEAPQGGQGFGYDPIFWVEAYQCSAAELPLAIKNQLSHRAQALAQLIHYFKKVYPQ